nr:uncharacterized protein wu:fc17b08 isoform X1 [Solea senegalensis]
MASQCKRQQCTIDRRGFRQELDSWRHKLIHCVGFESILEGLLGSELVEDLQLFKDYEPVAVSDWSFDENCLFCCLRRDKVKEHLIGLSKEGLEDAPKPPLVNDQTAINRLEKQAEEFLNAVLYRKDVPNFSDPHIPVVAREMLQRMIRQFAAEYTSKTSSPQDSCSDSQSRSDQSLPTPPSHSGAPPSASPAASVAGPAHNQNPVLSKLLMADQDAPLDLTIKKPPAEPSEQDGVLDLSIKKNRYSSNLPARSPCLSPATPTIKGESPDLRVAKAKDLQSTSTLEHFMAKLCPHHQRQIVDAMGFLQTEVKALATSKAHQASNSTSGIHGSAHFSAVTPEKAESELRFPSQSTPKSEVHDMSIFTPSSCAMKTFPESAVSLKTSVNAGPALDRISPGLVTNLTLVTPTTYPVDTENMRQGDHAPLKMKIMASNVADGKKLSCVLNTSLSSHSDPSETKQGNSNVSIRTETHSARLSSSLKRHSQASHAHQARHRDSLGNAKDSPAKLFSVHVTIPSESPRTARKSMRASCENRTRETACRTVVDPDLGHCDIVFIDKPITECFKEQQRSILPRRNARKSTRGHMYSDEIWELKTVRTLAGRGNCHNPMPELITLVTPKQILSKPEGLPPVDMPFAGTRRETINQLMSTEESDETGMIPGTGDVAVVADREKDVVVEISQTDQCQSKGHSAPSSPVRLPTESNTLDINTDVEKETTADLGTRTGSDETVAPAPAEAETIDEHDPQESISESMKQIVEKTLAEPFENVAIEEDETEVSSDKLCNSEADLQQDKVPSPMSQVEEEREGNEGEETQDKEPQELKPEAQLHHNDLAEESSIIGLVQEPNMKEPEVETTEIAESIMPLEIKDDDDHDDDDGGGGNESNDCDVSTKSLDTLLKELPPWRRKRGTTVSTPKRFKKTESVIVGYVNGRPISASDRSLRRRSSNSTTSPQKTPVKSSPNVASDTSVDSTTHSPVVEKHLPEENILVISAKVAPVVEQVTEQSETTPSPKSKVPQRTKQTPKEKKVQQPQDTLPISPDPPVDGSPSTESKRQLRSASQKPGTPVSLPTSVIPTSPQKQTGTLLSTELPPCLPLPFPLPATSPLPISSSSAAAPQQSQQNAVPESSMELNTEQSQPIATTSETNEVDNKSPAKQKLRSAKAVFDSDKNDEKEQSSKPTKRVLRKDTEASDTALPQKPNVASVEDRSASGNDCSPSVLDKPTRMPLRSECSRTETLNQSVTQSPPLETKKFALRSQTSAAPSPSSPTVAGRQSDVVLPTRLMPERITKAQVKSPSLSESSAISIVTTKPVPPKQTANKFFEALTGEDNQHRIANLNGKYDKMQKGWIQMDKESQAATKYKNKSDRQAAIWKSKRRARKPKSLEHQRYSPVQMLFMKGFNLTSICRWFLESTETKSLVIVKKVNTRLPSETQLCFHSSSSASGTSHGVFPSLQAERLKKHLKKFAIASPVKSTPKNQKLIAKALEQEGNAVKSKEKKELPSTTQTLTKSSEEASVQISESQKSSGKSKNPASARILRKYSNIRGKMQVQQTNVALKKAAKTLKNNKMKKLTATKSNLKPPLKSRRSPLAVAKQMKVTVVKMERRKALASKKTVKHLEKTAKTPSTSRASKDTTKKELPKRNSQRLGSPRTSDLANTSKNKIDNKKPSEVEIVEVVKPAVSKMHSSKAQTKESLNSIRTEIKDTENTIETPHQSTDVKGPTAPDQVLTRSQRKMEAALPVSGSPGHSSKRVTKSTTTPSASPKPARKAEEPTLTRSGALKSKRSRAALLPRTATQSGTKRAQDLAGTPAKRTRTSHSK